MRFIDAGGYTAGQAWEALDIAHIDDATVRLHWSDQPYMWHVNDGPEVFVVLDGAVDMHYREGGTERTARLVPGRICYAEPGDEHVAHPIGPARILVVERERQRVTIRNRGADGVGFLFMQMTFRPIAPEADAPLLCPQGPR